MDLDLVLVRAFAETAERLHFGRAAEHLGISQQALSKRVARLETLLPYVCSSVRAASG
ncbi:helix-turn-helix domain-containing protein [Microbispora siamensis]|nr:LysR family transcriptional regulator [Microbispora siamensis]